MKLQKEENQRKKGLMSKIRVKQIKSPIGRKAYQREILISLGLNKINRERFLENTPSTNGMIEKVKHLLEVNVEVDK